MRKVGGRPSKYRAEFCARVIELGKTGCSEAEMASACGVPRQTMWVWTKVHPEFRDSITHARSESQAWHERYFRENLGNPRFNASLAKLIVSAQFPDTYREIQRIEHSGPNGKPIEMLSREELRDRLSRKSIPIEYL